MKFAKQMIAAAMAIAMCGCGGTNPTIRFSTSLQHPSA